MRKSLLLEVRAIRLIIREGCNESWDLTVRTGDAVNQRVMGGVDITAYNNEEETLRCGRGSTKECQSERKLDREVDRDRKRRPKRFAAKN